MAITSTNSRWLLLALPLVTVTAGCCCEAFPLPGEAGCPTDARRIYCSPGEEAVRRCPCGPDSAFYGHKPTEWRSWPDGWRYGQYPCSAQMAGPVPEQPATAAPMEAGASVPNPFRDQGIPEKLPPAAAPPDATPLKESDNDSPDESLLQDLALPPEDYPTDASTKPPGEAGPKKLESAPVAPGQAAPIEPAPEKSPAEATHNDRPTSDVTALPKLIAPQRTPLVDHPKTTEPAAKSPTTAPTTVPATAWGGRPKAKAVKTGGEGAPVTKRVRRAPERAIC